jgi:hypothetical protein
MICHTDKCVVDALIAASNGCERDACKGSKLSVLQEGAWADMVLVDGDPTQDII